MSNRKLACLYTISLLLSVFLFISYPNRLGAGLIELDHIITQEGKSIILLGDEHGSNNFQEIEAMTNLLKEQDEQAKSITLFIEREIKNEFSFCSLSLSNYLEMYSFNKTLVKNIEIRLVANAILTLLNPETDLNYLSEDSFFQNESSPEIKVNHLTFRQLYDEYDYLQKALFTQYQKYNSTLQQFFNDQIFAIEKHYGQLHSLFNKWKHKYTIKEDEAIINLVQKIKQSEQSKLKKADPKNVLRNKLMTHIFKVFVPLFDLNAFDHIMQQKMSSDTILLVAGYLHTRTIKDWLTQYGQSSVQKSVDTKTINNSVVPHLTTLLNV